MIGNQIEKRHLFIPLFRLLDNPPQEFDGGLFHLRYHRLILILLLTCVLTQEAQHLHYEFSSKEKQWKKNLNTVPLGEYFQVVDNCLDMS